VSLIISTGASLHEETASIGRDYPGWHAWISDAGRVWAATPRSYAGGSGTTIDAPTPAAMRREIAETEREWAQVAA
jgi:hypothetical protein